MHGVHSMAQDNETVTLLFVIGEVLSRNRENVSLRRKFQDEEK
jgi:hypothetical protein